MNKKPKPLTILDTPIKTNIRKETIQEIVRLAIQKSKNNSRIKDTK